MTSSTWASTTTEGGDLFPALNNRPVTERHARLCREKGHATHTVDGHESDTCPRCGDVTQPLTDTAVMAQVTGSVGATTTITRRELDGSLTVERVEHAGTTVCPLGETHQGPCPEAQSDLSDEWGIIAPTASSCAIVARDFSNNVTDPLRDTWQNGHLRYVVAALGQQPVAVVIDKGTGSAAVGVTLVGVSDGGPSRGQLVSVRYLNADGTTQVTRHRTNDLGAIIPLAEGPVRGAKWAALDAQRLDHTAALRIAQARLTAEQPQLEQYGKWELRSVGADGAVHASYTPQREGAGSYWWTAITGAELVRA